MLAFVHLFGGRSTDPWTGFATCLGIVWILSFVGFVGRLRTIVTAAVLAQQADAGASGPASGPPEPDPGSPAAET